MKSNPNALWEQSLRLIKENVSEQQFNTWFKAIVLESDDEKDRKITVRVPSMFVYEYLEEKYVDLLRKVLTRVFGEGVRLAYGIVVDKTNNVGVVATPDDSVVGQSGSDKNTLSGSADSTEDSLPFDSQLNPKQTFENFIEGTSNKLPRSIGLSIAEHPSTSQFNPLFVFGPSGCGKTHLINAIGIRAKQLYPKMRVLYVSARLFQVQYVDASLKNTVNDFIKFYQTVDLLIVDDIQEWVTKSGTQNTFFHIFNHLFRNGKRIILASDRPPVDLKGMDERLITRFRCGLITELERPNVQLCMDILNSMVRRDGLTIPQEVIQYIAQTANGSVRDLQGVINSLLAYSVVYDSKVDLKLAERIVSRSVKVDNRPLTIDDILDKVCVHYQVTTEAVNSRSRKRDLVIPRQVSMYLAQKYTKMPASRIGKLVGDRDHSTVIHSCTQVEERMKIDAAFRSEIESIENSFKLKQFVNKGR